MSELIHTGKLSLVERIDLPVRKERRFPIPDAFGHGALRGFLASVADIGVGLWQHQSMALEHAAAGRNVVLSTGTASGKSLVFQAAGIRLILEDTDARVLVFYPLKALAGDQMVTWQKAVEIVGLPAETVGMIHGGVLADERARVMENARIIVMTPDVCHAWFMRQVSAPKFRHFLAGLRLLVIDEAHVLDAVFGSNCAFLLRRLQAARTLAARTRGEVSPLQIIAASATISGPATHLEALTGVSFALVGEVDDGSPTHERSLAHISVPDLSQDTVGEILRLLLDNSDNGSFIAFADSRQGVERIVDVLADEGVRPYRSGYEESDRIEIERALRDGALRGVVCTSALELGINIPHFSVGLNVGVPNSRKDFRQRVGRVGRSQPGIFALLADAAAFRRLGNTFEDYWEGSIEPSHLYLENRFMQFAHARCLSDELEVLGARQPVPPANVKWPEGFREVYNFARPGGARPREFDPIAQVGGDEPHRNYPLRNVGELSFKLQGVQATPDDSIGLINLQQAIREAYPGAVYMHLARRYRVIEWRNSAFERFIRIANTPAPPTTRPLDRTFVNAAVDHDGIVAGHYKSSHGGFLCECDLQITERVEGYREGGAIKLYRDLRQENPKLSTKTRDFRTTGVVMRIERPWFRENDIKQRIADALKDMIIREYSISPQDIGGVATNIALVRGGLREAISDAIVIYDGTYGSLRLTEPVFTNLGGLIERFDRARALTANDDDSLLPGAIVENLKTWWNELADDTKIPPPLSTIPQGFIQVLRRGSRVSRRDSLDVLHDIEILAPEMFNPADFGLEGPVRLFYQCRPDGANLGNATEKVPDDAIVRTGDEWGWVLWSPTTGEIKEETEEEDEQ